MSYKPWDYDLNHLVIEKTETRRVGRITVLFGCGLVLMFLLSLWYWKQRVFILDASFQSFSLIASGDYAIQVQRYGAVLVQSLPLLLLKVGAPLWVILVGYSASFTLYPLLLFGALLWMRKPVFAWALALFFLLIMKHTFFWIQSELIQATALAIFTLGVYTKNNWSIGLRSVLSMLLSVVVVYAHPLGIAPLLFGMVFVGIHETGLKNVGGNKRTTGTGYFIVLPVVSLGFFLIKQFYLGTGDYDQTAVEMIEHLPKHLPEVYKLPSTILFVKQCLNDYQLIPFVFFALVYWYINTNKWLKLLALIGAVLIWLIVILCTWWYGAEQFYIESYYLVLGCFLGLPLALDVFPQLNATRAYWLIVALIIFRFVHIVWAGRTYVDRLTYVGEIVSAARIQSTDQRYVVPKEYINMNLLQMEWGLPYETLLYASVTDPDEPVTVLVYEGESPPEHVKVFEKNGFATPWGPHKYEWFAHPEYFGLNDTTEVKRLVVPVEF